MIEEKTYFRFTLGKWLFILKDNYEYTDKETGKAHFSKVFSIRKANVYDDWYDQQWFNFYTGWHHVNFVYDTIDYEDKRHNIRFSLGWGQVYLYLPILNKHRDWEDVNNPEPKYGFYFYGEGKKLFDSFWYYTNKNGKNDVKCIRMPWGLDFYRHSVLLKDGTWWTILQKDVRKARKNKTYEWNNPNFNINKDDERILKKVFPFTYTTKEGEVQNTTATCFIEEREWRQKWLRWTKLFNTVCTKLSISFANEMGNQRDSWKGGVLGVSAPITKEEKENADMESALRRYEEKVNRIHDYCR